MDPLLPDREKIEAETALFLARVKELTEKGWDPEKARRVAILEHPWAEDPDTPRLRTRWRDSADAQLTKALARTVFSIAVLGAIALVAFAVIKWAVGQVFG